MEEKELVKVKATHSDLQFMLGAALRYGLGRKTYATSLIPEVISDNISLFNESSLTVMLRDIEMYERDRIAWEHKDDNCDYDSWMKLKKLLQDELMKKHGNS